MPYHVRIEVEKARGGERDEVVVDLAESAIYERFIAPWQAGRPLFVNGRILKVADIERFRISHTPEDSAAIIPRLRYEDQTSDVIFIGGPSYASRVAAAGTDVTDELIGGIPRWAGDPVNDPAGGAKDRVMVVHGRNLTARDAVYAFLNAVSLRPVEWSQAVAETGDGAPYVGAVLDQAFSMARAVIVLMSGDDLASLHPALQHEQDPKYEIEPTPQARPNVLLEAGMALAFRPKQTIILEHGELRPASDLLGRHVIRTSDPGWRIEMARRLSVAGCAVHDDGDAWRTAGSFA